MVFSSVIPSNEELDIHYSAYPTYPFLNDTTRKRYNVILDELDKYRNTGRILDVGCGEGFFLEEAAKRNWKVYGIETAGHLADKCTAKSINIHHGNLDSASYDDNFFDVIISIEVIEHLAHPAPEINCFGKYIRTGGAVYLTTPNFNSLSSKMLGNTWKVIEYPEHLNYFTPRTLKKLFTLYGFRSLKLATTGVSIEQLKTAFTTKAKKNESDLLHETDHNWQEKIEGNIFLKLFKSVINFSLSAFGAGDTIKAVFIKE
jgi:2-polyprenyl-3-methyl-5-hydroxy-6-metoxy-1,4-benzoquinol methylase